MLIARQVELIDKHIFIKKALTENFKTFIIHMVILEVLIIMIIDFSRLIRLD